MDADIALEGYRLMEPRYETTLRKLLAAVEAVGGDLDTALTIEADGEPVYITAHGLEIPPGSSLDHAGTDRRTYEEPHCGNHAAHGQHFYEPMASLRINCPGSFGEDKS